MRFNIGTWLAVLVALSSCSESNSQATPSNPPDTLELALESYSILDATENPPDSVLTGSALEAFNQSKKLLASLGYSRFGQPSFEIVSRKSESALICMDTTSVVILDAFGNQVETAGDKSPVVVVLVSGLISQFDVGESGC